MRIAPDKAAAHVILGRCYFASGEEEKAASEYEAATKLDPQDGEAYFALGQMRKFQHRTPQAEQLCARLSNSHLTWGPPMLNWRSSLWGRIKTRRHASCWRRP